MKKIRHWWKELPTDMQEMFINNLLALLPMFIVLSPVIAIISICIEKLIGG